jgi:outer membrane lipoprotein-sorting protein
MFETLVAGALMLADAVNPIQSALDHYRDVAAYQVTVKSSGGTHSEILRYYFKQPGHVRMEFVMPYNGAVLVYNPVRKQVRLWPFGYRSFPAFTLSPGNRLIQSATGQRVDRSDVGALYRNVQSLQEQGRTEVGGIELRDGKETLRVTVEGNGGYSVGMVHRYQLWLDRVTGFPIKVSSHDVTGRLIEVVEMEGLLIDPVLPDGFFDQ